MKTPSFKPNADEQRHSALQQMMAEVTLKEMRDAFDGRLVLFKGLEVACRYRDPSERTSVDVDVLCDDAEGLQAALLGIGLQPMESPLPGLDTTTLAEHRHQTDDHHHLWPLVRAAAPVVVEVHRSPGWLAGMTPPSTASLLAGAVPSRTGIDGIETLEPAAHAVYLAVHSWRDRPFHRHRDLTDIEMLLEDQQTAARADELATQWGINRIWGWYRNAIAVAAGKERPKLAVRAFGGHRYEPGNRSALGGDVGRFLGRFCIDHPLHQLSPMAQRLRTDLRPLPGERRRDKAKRILNR